MTERRRLSGLYFVVNPSEDLERLLIVLEGALKGGVDLVQVWSASDDKKTLIEKVRRIRKVTERYHAPLIINNDADMARRAGADGVHMDGYDLTPAELRRKVGESCIVGYTTGNDLDRVKWAEREGADYISFCSIYPSPSVAECDLVPLETIRTARKIIEIPIFASGGIKIENAREVLEAGADGIAVISAIQRAVDPEKVACEFKGMIDSVLTKRVLTTKMLAKEY